MKRLLLKNIIVYGQKHQSLSSMLLSAQPRHPKLLLVIVMFLFFADRYEMQSSWALTEGFVVEEGKAILPHRAATRTNLTENQLALILLAFTNAGLLEVRNIFLKVGTWYLLKP